MKKEYLKPEAEYINLYSEEKITGISLEEGMRSERDVNAGWGGEFSLPEIDGWE